MRVFAAKQDQPFRTKDPAQSLIPQFTRERERAVGRLATLGLAFSWVGETLTGYGPITQLSNETGVPVVWGYGVTLTLIAIQLFFGLNSGTPTYSDENQRDVAKRSKGLTGITQIEPDVDRVIDPTKDPGQFFLRLELAQGRTAMLVFLTTAILEFANGGMSPLGQAGIIPTGVPFSQAPIWLIALTILNFVGGIGTFSLFDQNKDSAAY
ncbi:Photosystem II 22 kDa protein, chloroplastic [Auxenochlorella protothecoides]|nr:Photosystem II 22 kDa protein, chloroplastic [Auxenochlorella protothecoides]KFM23429.1 Photosystem II 22 kDa protein, chloroplastic [Auxenochlorella protothecoides]RMZ55177.1 hypothetical protein APUTEX25_005455 [Auxenochlorella protothecoides]|eukprot:RMZ55177.1 hypothetical protein APUTEX25_005455 [Auxenochlorella protothecoides]